MILPESRSLEWITKTAADNHASNPILVEKVIRAFSLLEALARFREVYRFPSYQKSFFVDGRAGCVCECSLQG